jgi:hypothetical protein
VRLGRDHADDRHLQPLLELRQRSRGSRVAGRHDELDPLRLEVARDLARIAADLVERPRPVGEPGEVTEVEEILVRHRHQALVQNREPARARVEDAYRPGVHGAIVG